jgi:hypothetical protein
MSDDEDKSMARLSRWVIAGVLVFVVYPLSVFPVFFIAGATGQHRPGSGLVFRAIYLPLELIAQAVPAIGGPLGDSVDASYAEGRRWKVP